MKVLMLIAGFVLLVIVMVVVVGALLPKRHVVTRGAAFRAAPDRLFALIDGPQGWRPELKSSEAISGPDGRSQVRETSRDGETIAYDLLDRVPPASITRRMATPGLPYTGSWKIELQPEGAGTLVRVTEDGEVFNPIFRFVSRFVIGQTGSIERYLKALGKAVGEDVSVVQ